MAFPHSEPPIFAEGYFSLGASHLAASRLAEAEASFLRAILLLPGYPEAYRHLGRARRQQGKKASAIVAYRRTTRLCPDVPAYRQDLGRTLAELGEHAEAAAVLRSVLAEQPDNAEALCNLGTACLASGRRDVAERAYQQALAVFPAYPHALFNLGTIHQESERTASAIALYGRTLRTDPGFVRAACNLGYVYEHQGRFDEAIAAYAAAIGGKPDDAVIHYNLGTLYQGQGRLDDAARAYGEAIRRRPGFADARFSLGTVLHEQKRPDEAMAQYRDVLDDEPGHQGARINLGTLLLDKGRVTEADDAYSVAVAGESMPEAHWNLALIRLLRGDFAAGWREYEWRWQTKDYGGDARSFDDPAWNGEAGAGRTILLHAEQGLGDTLQFCRYAPAVAARGWRVVLEVQAPLRTLLNGLDGVQVVARGEGIPPHDAHCPLMSLPRVFGTTLDSVPARVPYLRSDVRRAAWARERVGDGPQFRVGLVWAGNPAHRNDQRRSIPAALLRPLLDVPGIRFFSLQKEPRPGEREIVAGWSERLVDLGPALDDFADTAALVEALDLVVAVDTSVVHLAGALARPVWVLLPHVPDWRWLLEREDSPWYPTARLFRQDTDARWEPVIRRVAEHLYRAHSAGTA